MCSLVLRVMLGVPRHLGPFLLQQLLLLLLLLLLLEPDAVGLHLLSLLGHPRVHLRPDAFVPFMGFVGHLVELRLALEELLAVPLLLA